MGVKHKSIKEALEYVSRHPEPSGPPIAMPVWELVGRHLFEIATTVTDNPRQLKKVNSAQKILSDRMSGRRGVGTAPAEKREQRIVVADFTKEIT